MIICTDNYALFSFKQVLLWEKSLNLIYMGQYEIIRTAEAFGFMLRLANQFAHAVRFEFAV